MDNINKSEERETNNKSIVEIIEDENEKYIRNYRSPMAMQIWGELARVDKSQNPGVNNWIAYFNNFYMNVFGCVDLKDGGIPGFEGNGYGNTNEKRQADIWNAIEETKIDLDRVRYFKKVQETRFEPGEIKKLIAEGKDFGLSADEEVEKCVLLMPVYVKLREKGYEHRDLVA